MGIYNLIASFFVILTGFAGYFDATLYKDVHLGMEPLTATPNMFSWSVTFVCIVLHCFEAKYQYVLSEETDWDYLANHLDFNIMSFSFLRCSRL